MLLKYVLHVLKKVTGSLKWVTLSLRIVPFFKSDKILNSLLSLSHSFALMGNVDAIPSAWRWFF